MSGIDASKIAQEAIDAISEKVQNLKTLNIIVAGKTGVGKSTLINAVFKDNLANTGMGKPVTTHMRRISKKGIPLAIYDTRGFELGKEVQAEVKKEVINTISKGLATKDINKTIHCIWYCINTASTRRNRMAQRTIHGQSDYTGSNYRCSDSIFLQEKSSRDAPESIE